MNWTTNSETSELEITRPRLLLPKRPRFFCGLTTLAVWQLVRVVTDDGVATAPWQSLEALTVIRLSESIAIADDLN